MRLVRFIAVVGGALGAVVGSTPAAGQELVHGTGALSERDDGFYERLALDPRAFREQQFLASLMAGPHLLPTRKRKSLDLTPLAEMAVGYFQGWGVPMVEHFDESGKRPIAFTAQFAVGEDSPNIRMHLGDRPLESMGAFYPAKKGFRFSVVYPMENLSLRLEGGEDSEFGSLAVAGLSWVHPSKRYAFGIGLPMKLKNSESDFGAIFQFRMNLR